MYRHIAEEPHAGYHFGLGRAWAVRLGYSADVLDRTRGSEEGEPIDGKQGSH